MTSILRTPTVENAFLTDAQALTVLMDTNVLLLQDHAFALTIIWSTMENATRQNVRKLLSKFT
jgi:hypothetical protein